MEVCPYSQVFARRESGYVNELGEILTTGEGASGCLVRQTPSGLALVDMDFRRGVVGLGDRPRTRRCLVARFGHATRRGTAPGAPWVKAIPRAQRVQTRANGDFEMREPVSAEPILTLPFHRDNLTEMRTLVAASADHAGLDGPRIDDLLVVATELATNAIRHAGGAGVLRLWLGGGALHCRVTDEGPGLADPERAGAHLVSTTSDEGRGLWLARRLSDSLNVVVRSRGTSVTASFNLP